MFVYALKQLFKRRRCSQAHQHSAQGAWALHGSIVTAQHALTPPTDDLDTSNVRGAATRYTMMLPVPHLILPECPSSRCGACVSRHATTVRYQNQEARLITP